MGNDDDDAKPARESGNTGSNQSFLARVKKFFLSCLTLVELELDLQKTRLIFILKRSRTAIFASVLGVLILHLGLITLAVGLVIGLTPYITALGATLAVFFFLIILAAWAFYLVKKALSDISNVLKSSDENDQLKR